MLVFKLTPQLRAKYDAAEKSDEKSIAYKLFTLHDA